MKDSENLLSIENTQKQKLYYRFTPAAIASNFVPLIVVVDSAEEVPHFEYKMWNVLSLVDGISDENLLQELISQIADEYECEEHIYLYGGKEAIFHGVLCKAHAVYATESLENNLDSLFNTQKSFPIFYLCNETDERKNFIQVCKRHEISLHLDKCIKLEEDEKSTIQKVLDMFERMNPEL